MTLKSNGEKSQTCHRQTTQIFRTAIEQREQACTKPRVVKPQTMIFTQHQSQRKRKTEPVIAKPPKYFKKADQCQTLKSKHREV